MPSGLPQLWEPLSPALCSGLDVQNRKSSSPRRRTRTLKRTRTEWHSSEQLDTWHSDGPDPGPTGVQARRVMVVTCSCHWASACHTWSSLSSGQLVSRSRRLSCERPREGGLMAQAPTRTCRDQGQVSALCPVPAIAPHRPVTPSHLSSAAPNNPV